MFVPHYESFERKINPPLFLPSPVQQHFLSFYSSVLLLISWKAVSTEKCSFWESSIKHILFSKTAILSIKVRWRWSVGAVVHTMHWHQQGMQPTTEWSWCFTSSSLKILKGFNHLPMCISTVVLYNSFFKKTFSPFLSLVIQRISLFSRWTFFNPFKKTLFFGLCATWNCWWDKHCLHSLQTCYLLKHKYITHMPTHFQNLFWWSMIWEILKIYKCLIKTGWQKEAHTNKCVCFCLNAHVRSCPWAQRPCEPRELILSIRISVGKRD